jgi:hypothetical protein
MQFVFRLFTTSEYQTIKSRIFKERLILSFKRISEDINTLLKSIMLLEYRWREIILAIIF